MDNKLSMKQHLGKFAVCGGIAFGISCFDIKCVRGSSMDPTLCDGDRMFCERAPFMGSRIKLNDLVTFYPAKYPDKLFVKRVTGVPGDAYTDNGAVKIIPDGNYFVMGDNAEVSEDSRDLGLVDSSSISSRVLGFVWSDNTDKIFRSYSADYALIHADAGGSGDCRYKLVRRN